MRILWCALVVSVALGCMQGIARADLIEADLVDADDDGLLTWDTATNLMWLDLTATTGWSASQIDSGADGWLTTQGFRYATVEEVGVLFEHAAGGLAVDFANDTVNNLVAVDQLFLLLGITGDLNGYDRGYGITGDLSKPGSTLTNRVFAAYGERPSTGLLRPWFGTATEFHWGNDMGHFLVRAVPEPTTLALFGLGAMSILALRRRKIVT